MPLKRPDKLRGDMTLHVCVVANSNDYKHVADREVSCVCTAVTCHSPKGTGAASVIFVI